MNGVWQALALHHIVACAARLQLFVHGLRDHNENEVRFNRPHWTKTDARQAFGEPISHTVGVPGEGEPKIVCKKRLDLNSKKAMLRDEVAAAFAPFRHSCRS